MPEAEVNNADKLKAVLATRDGAVQVLTALSEASRCMDGLKTKVRNGKIRVAGWASHKKAVAGVYTGCGIGSAVLGIIAGYYVGVFCLCFVALSIVFIILLSKTAYALSLKDYYNREAIYEIKEAEAELAPMEKNIGPVLDLLPEGYSSTQALDYMLKMLRLGRADNFSQARKCWDEERKKGKAGRMEQVQILPQLGTVKSAKDIRNLKADALIDDLYHNLKYR